MNERVKKSTSSMFSPLPSHIVLSHPNILTSTSDVDSSFFVLTVDLWSADGNQEVNLVRHSSGAPTVSISTSTVTSYPPPPDRIYNPGVFTPVTALPGGQYMPAPHHPGVQQPGYYLPSPQTPVSMPGYPGYPPPQPQAPPGYMPMPQMHAVSQPAPATGMFTRNLIGSLTVNAFKLNDTENKTGFWFVLQDLSVRTEGSFRLKMNFVDVGSGQGNNTLNTGKAPVLATCFSDVFQVYSAKKFPGVIESTPLSKAFASQGIKIPIRKDGPKQLSNQAEYDADD